jgi:hypothetical protein
VSSKCRVFLFNTKGAGAYSYHSALKGPRSKGKVYGRENAVREPVEGGEKFREPEGGNSGSLNGHFFKGRVIGKKIRHIILLVCSDPQSKSFNFLYPYHLFHAWLTLPSKQWYL